MRIWRPTAPRDSGFAAIELRGAWTPSGDSGPCPEYGASRQQRAMPLRMVWEPGSDRVGDFAWAGFGPEVVATAKASDELSRHFGGFDLGPVEILDDRGLADYERGLPRVRLPYSGPLLRELWVTRWVGIDRERSSVELDRRCGTCATEFWSAYGTQRWDSHFEVRRGTLVRELVPRAPNGGLFVREDSLLGSDLFRVREFPGWTLCTDASRDHVERKGYTNVAFLEMGETLERG